MGGITGWVDFRRDLGRHRPVVESMTGELARRGPDGGGVWIDRPVALGHRQFLVRPTGETPGPYLVERDGRPLAAATFSGSLLNGPQVRELLTGRGVGCTGDSAAELVAHGYLEWGDAVVERLRGRFAFAVWDVARQELVLGRDRLGVEPLYYYPLEDGLLFGSEPKAILANPAASAVVDLDGLREALAFVKTPGHAIFRGMHELRPGHLLRVHRGGSTLRRYWALRSWPHPDDLPTTVRRVRELLESSVADNLVPGANAFLLSGGIDSSTLTVLATRALAERGQHKIPTFALDYAGYSENFQADERRETDDQYYVRRLLGQLPAEHTDVRLDATALADADHKAAMFRAADLPVTMGDINTSLYLLLRSVAASHRLVYSGEGADELFGGYRWLHNPTMVAAGNFPWLAPVPVETGFGASILHPDLVRTLDVPGYQHRRYHEALAEVPYLPGETGSERRMRELSYLALTRYLPVLLDRGDRMGRLAGVELRLPFCDESLVEYVFNAPWAMKTADGREKSLLRAAVSDVLPEEILLRRKSHFPQNPDAHYDRALQRDLGRLVERGGGAVGGLLDPDAVRRLLATPIGDRTVFSDRGDMEGVMELNDWLERYDIRLEL